MKLTSAQLVQRLRSHGVSFTEFSMIHEGDYAREDGDWNYKDCSHVEHVHQLVQPIWTATGNDICSSMNFQKALGMRFFLSVCNYQPEPWVQTYHTSWLFYIFIMETRYEEIARNRTKVTTTYTIGAPSFLKWTHGILRWALKKNYAILMKDDIPMRHRRGKLRSWGYSFRKTRETYTFVETLDISNNNLINPKEREYPKMPALILDNDLPEGGEKLLGNDDHYGLRLVRSKNQVNIYPRLCPHEGACLDNGSMINGRVKCPWHGRFFAPIASFNLLKRERQKAVTDYHEISLENGAIQIRKR